MEIKKLFYVTNAVPPDNDEPAWSLAVQKLGFEETIYFITGESTRWEKSLRDHGVQCRFLIEETPSHNIIMDRAREEEASLIATNLVSMGASVSRRSITRNLIRSTDVPILLIPEQTSVIQASDKGLFDNVIFAIDWSPFSQNCMDALRRLKGIIGELEIVTVITKKLSIRDMIKLKDTVEETRSTFLDEGIDAEAHIYAGKPAEEINLAVKDYDGSIIVMGASHRSALKSMFYGNCTYDVADKAMVPVLVIP
jgi:nucleotide-binding universal stress UspA family protein